MKNIILHTLLISLYFVGTNANAVQTNQLDMNKLPQPDGGIKVVPSSQLSLTESQIKDEENRLQQISTKGYVDIEYPYAQELMSYKYRGKTQIDANKDNHDPYDTHLKASASEIKLAFQYKDIPMHAKANIIGYAAGGGWEKGWTGISVFFDDPALGVCVFTLNNLKLTHGAANIGKESARYDINKMPNIVDVRGNEKTGFVYDISWFNNDYSKELECANESYDANITKALIDDARTIDKTA